MNHRQLSSRPDTPAYEVPSLLGTITNVFRVTSRSRPVVALSLAVLSLGLMVPAARAQTVIDLPRGFTGATAPITLTNPLTGGSIYLNLSQGGRTF